MRRFEDVFAEVGRGMDVLSEQFVEGVRNASRWAKERWEDLERWWAGTSAQNRTSTIGLIVVIGAAAVGGAAWSAAAILASDAPELTAEDVTVLRGLEARMAEMGASASQPTGARPKRRLTPH